MREYKKTERGKGRERVLKRDKRMRERREKSRMTQKNKERTHWKTEQQDISTKMNWAREEKEK